MTVGCCCSMTSASLRSGVPLRNLVGLKKAKFLRTPPAKFRSLKNLPFSPCSLHLQEFGFLVLARDSNCYRARAQNSISLKRLRGLLCLWAIVLLTREGSSQFHDEVAVEYHGAQSVRAVIARRGAEAVTLRPPRELVRPHLAEPPVRPQLREQFVPDSDHQFDFAAGVLAEFRPAPLGADGPPGAFLGELDAP